MFLKKVVIGLLLSGTIVFSIFIFLVGVNEGSAMAIGIAKMAWGLIALWIFIGGTLMYCLRDSVRVLVLSIPLQWQVKFVLFATILALIEEAITTLLTNLAPAFGSKVGEAYITASANYFDVVLFHSVIVFVPLFIAWSWVLSRYDFKPFSVFLLFGLMGVVCESTFIGPTAFFGFPMWIFVYGLMVYLPTYCLPDNRGARSPGFVQYVLVIPKVFLFSLPLLIPIVLIVTKVFHHPAIHF